MKLYFATVINDGNGLPVEGATVSFLIDDVAQTTYATSGGGGGATSSVTDANGLYQRYVPDGTYTVRHSYTYAGTTYTVDIDDVQIYDDSEQEEIVNRSLTVPDGEDGITIPAIAARSGKFLYFDSAGDPQVTVGTGNLNLTSSTSNSIAGSGSKSWTATTGAQTAVGMDYKASDASNPANYMYGYVTAYNSTTGALTMTITSSGGSGTITDWSITPAPSANTLTTAGGTIAGSLAITGTLAVTGGVTGSSFVRAAASTTSDASYRAPHGSAPSSPVNGDIWTTTTGLFVQINSATKQAATLTDTQTLTNKTLTAPTINTAIISGPKVTETVFTITDGASVDIDPANGGMQFWTLGANRTATATNFANGQSITLHVADGTAYAVTWPTMTWVGASAPTLPTSGYAVIVLWKAGGTLYGKYVGNVA